MAATARWTSFVCTSYEVVVFLLMAGSESAIVVLVYILVSVPYTVGSTLHGPLRRVVVDFN